MADKKKNKDVKKSNPENPVEVKEHRNTLQAWICAAAIILITFFVFSPVLDNGFTNWDDNDYVVNNPLVVANSVPWVKILESPVMGNYHPITILSLALNYQTGDLDPYGYHLENLIFHLLNTLLVFLFIFLLTRSNLLMASIVALFFGIHPMHVESVAWVSERKDVLYVFFFMAGLIAYLRYSDTKKTSWYFFTLLLFVLSCLSKGMAIVFPVILVLIDYLQGVKWEKKSVFEKIPFFILSVVFGIIAFTQQAAQAFIDTKYIPVFHRILFGSYGAVMYIVKFFIPFKLSAIYQYPGTTYNHSIPLMFYISPLLLLGALALLLCFFLKKQKEIVFGLLFYFVSVAMVLQFISFGNSIMADRYSYLSYVGLLFIVAYIINKVWQNKKGVLAILRYPFVAIIIIGAVVFSFQTYALTQVWKNSETLWTETIDNYPDAPGAYGHRAEYYYFIHDDDKSLADLNKLLQLNPTDKKAYYNRAGLYYKKGEFNPAMSDYNKVIELDSGYPDAYYNRGICFNSLNEYELAIKDFTKCIQLNPKRADLYYNMRGIGYGNEKKYDTAIVDFSKAIEISPSIPDYWLNRSTAENLIGQTEKAKADALKAQQLQGN